MMKFRNQKGFTLLEIMLVVLIIGIIALLALPRLLVTRRMAQEQTCLGDQSAIRTHLEAYKWDWGTYPGSSITAGAINPITSSPADDFLSEFLYNPRYWPSGDPAPEKCPIGSDPGNVPNSTGDGRWVYDVTIGADGGASEYTLLCPNGHEPATGM